MRIPSLGGRPKTSFLPLAIGAGFDLSARFHNVLSSGRNKSIPIDRYLSFSPIFVLPFLQHYFATLTRSRIRVRRGPDISSLTHCLLSDLSSSDRFRVAKLESQSGVSMPNSINRFISTSVMLHLLLSTFKHNSRLNFNLLQVQKTNLSL